MIFQRDYRSGSRARACALAPLTWQVVLGPPIPKDSCLRPYSCAEGPVHTAARLPDGSQNSSLAAEAGAETLAAAARCCTAPVDAPRPFHACATGSVMADLAALQEKARARV